MFPRLDPGPAPAFDLDWWRIPIGGGVMHWCPDCAAGHVEELLDAGAWTVEPDEAGDCESCALREAQRHAPGPMPEGVDLVVACDTGD